MPSYPCRWPTCTAYIRDRGYCADHQAEGQRDRSRRNQFYDEHVRDPEAKRFYDSAAWQRARATKLANNPVCERCLKTWASHVHHVKPLNQCTPAERLAQANLAAVCQPCHNTIEADARRDARTS